MFNPTEYIERDGRKLKKKVRQELKIRLEMLNDKYFKRTVRISINLLKYICYS